MESPLVKIYVGANTIGKHLCKNFNVDFLLGESDMIIDIPGDENKTASGTKERRGGCYLP